MAIPFTQYLRPDGRKAAVWIDLDKSFEDRAQLIIDAGLRFETEVLMGEMVSFTITGFDPDAGEEQDLRHALVENGPKVTQAVQELIRGFDLDTYKTKMKALDVGEDAKQYHKDTDQDDQNIPR